MSSSIKLPVTSQSVLQLQSTTKLNFDSFIFRWKIKVPTFDKLFFHDPLESPVFKGGDHSQHSWKLSWKRCECTYSTPPYYYHTVSLNLAAVGNLQKTQANSVTVGTVISFKGQKERSQEEIEEENKNMSFTTIRMGQFVSSPMLKETELVDATKGFLVDNEIVIYCHIHLKSGPMHSEISKSIFSGMNYEKKESDDPFYLVTRKGFNASEFADVTLVTQSKSLSAHKFILAAQSSVFAAMFRANMLESKESSVKITDFEPDIVEAMVEYLYTRNCVKIKELSLDLFRISDKYQIMKLKYECEREMCSNLNAENAVKILLMANLYGATTLKAAAIQYIIWNKDEVRKTQDFQNLKDPAIWMELFLAI